MKTTRRRNPHDDVYLGYPEKPVPSQVLMDTGLDAEIKQLRAGLAEVLDVYSTYQHLDAILSKTGGRLNNMLAKFWSAIKKAAVAAKGQSL